MFFNPKRQVEIVDFDYVQQKNKYSGTATLNVGPETDGKTCFVIMAGTDGDGDVEASSITFNGNTITDKFADVVASSGDSHFQMWYVENVPGTTANVSINWASGDTNGMTLAAITVVGLTEPSVVVSSNTDTSRSIISNLPDDYGYTDITKLGVDARPNDFLIAVGVSRDVGGSTDIEWREYDGSSNTVSTSPLFESKTGNDLNHSLFSFKKTKSFGTSKWNIASGVALRNYTSLPGANDNIIFADFFFGGGSEDPIAGLYVMR